MAEINPAVEQFKKDQVKKQQIEHLYELICYLEHLAKRVQQVTYPDGVRAKEWSDKEFRRFAWLAEEQELVSQEINDICSRIELVDESDTTVTWGKRPVRTRAKADQRKAQDARGWPQ